MTYTCEIKEQPAQPVLSIRTRTSAQNLPQELGKAYGAIAQYLGELGQSPAGAPFTAYYNMDMQDLDVEIGIPVATALPGKGEIQAREIPAGKMATTVHIGPYQEMEPAYHALMQWMQEHGYAGTGVAYECYLNDPAETAPDQLQTQIMFVLA